MAPIPLASPPSILSGCSIQYNPQEYGSSGCFAPSSSSDTTLTSTDERYHSPTVGDQQPPLSHRDDGQQQKRHAVSQQRQSHNPPTIATKTVPCISSSGDPDLDDVLEPSNTWISPSSGPPSHQIAADMESRPSQDSVNTLDKGGHLWYSDQDQS